MSATPLDGQFLRSVADDIDRLITIDLNRRGAISTLYTAARATLGQPLVLAAAECLRREGRHGTVAFIATGWPDRPWIDPRIGELDGPPGSALLARALHRMLGVVPVFLIESQLCAAMCATARAAGFTCLEPDQAIAAISSPAPIHAASVLPFPIERVAAISEASRLVNEYAPGVMISVEKGGANRKGVIHNARGQDTTRHLAKVEELVKVCIQRGIPTIGIGDGGNEIGMGVIEDTVRSSIPFGNRCDCPCGGGIAPSQRTDFLITASVSNWGAYGLAACLAVLMGDPEGLHDEEMELRALREAADAGLIDGNTGYIDPGADGIGVATHAAVITILRQLVRNALHPFGLAAQRGTGGQ